MRNIASHWLISGFLLLWGMAYAFLVIFTFALSTPEHWAELVSQRRIKAEYAEYISNIPVWVIAITFVAAFTRLLGAILLLLRNSWAFCVYAISLGVVMVIMFRGFVLADVASVIRPSQIILEVVFLLISLFAVYYAKKQNRGRN
ncbi:hypothetical protein P2G88_18150 [Aliiglaciecola sp. CAU 1673]|uniref:hypothetical protein n=1 Tax=Aliiglaciecola sp. CAU 1673 TaxID=3032595 RepID=UPI0023D9F628|nr:hypothetical protein [Aliiglaciecola sp. CAU 1673]MDF2180181.1 hypothetical protein [Aliiglaciecola sp. CAU 1673]